MITESKRTINFDWDDDELKNYEAWLIIAPYISQSKKLKIPTLKDKRKLLRQFERIYNKGLFNKIKRLLGWLLPIKYFFDPTEELLSKSYSKKYYWGDLHTHLNYLGSPRINGIGEGVDDIERILGAATVRNIKVLGTTPHFKMHNVENSIKYVDKLNFVLGKLYEMEGFDYEEVIYVPGLEITSKGEKGIEGGHVLCHAYGANQKNANFIEALSRTLQSNHSTIKQLINIQNKLNAGVRVINGYTIPENVRQNVYMTVTPAHYSDFRGIGKKSILKLYDEGYDLLGLETTNTTSNLLQDNLGSILREEYGGREDTLDLYNKHAEEPVINCINYLMQDDLSNVLRELYGRHGPADFGGSDSHNKDGVGIGYMTFKRPKNEINNSHDVFDCILNHETTSNYLKISKLKRMVLSKSQYLKLLYWTKFFFWLVTR